jgi:hypothetical protein
VQLRKAVTTLLCMGFEPMHYAAIRNGYRARCASKTAGSELDRVYESLFMDIVQRGWTRAWWCGAMRLVAYDHQRRLDLRWYCSTASCGRRSWSAKCLDAPDGVLK